jgi:multiple sugar transport system substrate-binding protein
VSGRRLLVIIAWLVSLLISVSVLASAETVLQFAYRSGGEPRKQVVETWIREFERSHPHVRIEWLPVGEEKVVVSMLGGVGPDVTEVFGDFAQRLAGAGLLLDLRPFVKRDFGAQEIADFWPPAWDASFVKFGSQQGVQFRIPRYMLTTVFYYNEDLFRQGGLATPAELDARGAWDWVSLRSSAKKLTRRTGDTISTYGFVTNTTAWRRIVNWARATGGDFFDPRDPTRFIGDMPEAVEGISFLQNMIWEDQCMAPGWAHSSFYQGKVGVVEDGIHAIMDRFETRIQQAFAWNIVPTPVGPTGRNAYTGDDGFSIWINTQHPEEAWKFVKFMTSKDGQDLMIRHEGLAPVRQSAMRSYSAVRPHLNLYSLALNMQQAAPPIASYLVGDVSRIGEIMTQVLQTSLVDNDKPYEQAAREAKPVLESLIRESMGR